MTRPRDRLLNSLPAIYRAADESGEHELRHLLSAFEDVMFAPARDGPPGIEQEIEAIPSLFAPLGIKGTGRPEDRKTPDRFLAWLTGWVAFSPWHFFTPEELRNIVARITPMYGRRGTRKYLEDLLRLCIRDLHSVEIDEQPPAGFRVGHARVGIDSLLIRERPFWFRVAIEIQEPEETVNEHPESRSLVTQRVRAIIDFAKPAHTAYDLDLRFRHRHRSDPGASHRLTT
jgi:phage tail-like protein